MHLYRPERGIELSKVSALTQLTSLSYFKPQLIHNYAIDNYKTQLIYKYYTIFLFFENDILSNSLQLISISIINFACAVARQYRAS